MRRPLSFLLAALLSSSLLFAATLPELYQKVKEQFRMRSYAAALEGIDHIRAECQKPENEQYRTALQPVIAFYRGASLAALGRESEARSEFEVFLAFQPNASLDPAIYPKPVISALEETRKSLRQKHDTPEETGAMAASYRAFHDGAPEKREDPGSEWADGPVRVLLSSEQRREYEHLADPVSRSEFITKFWKSHDSRPESGTNEFRLEFERRVAFADSHFTENELRGSLTDRGMVFLLLGPPTYVGRQPIRTGEDAADPSGMSQFSRNDIVAVQKTSGPSAATNLKIDNMTGPSNTLPESSMRWREVWHYRRELLPRTVPYQQVDFEFITKKGYGFNVLQRNSEALNAIEAARKGAESGNLNASR